MKKPLPKHTSAPQFPKKNGCLVIGGIELTRLAQRIGQTPFYAYDRNLLTERVKILRSHLPDEVHIHYAMKANPMPAIVQHMATIVDGFDVASAGEMKVALDTIMPADLISIAGPGKRREELACAIAAGITINIESESELKTIVQQSNELGIQANVAVRINPAFELKASGMQMGGGPKQFGIDEERVPDVLKEIKSYELHFAGFHIFSGSQNLKADSIADAQRKSIDLAIRLSEYCPEPIRKLNIGGGFGIPYFPGENLLDIEHVGSELANNMIQVKQNLPEADVIVELGRYLVGEAGIYVSRIIDRKISREQIFLITDGGLHHHLAASGNFGQIIRKNYPVTVGNKMDDKDTEVATVVGPLCTPLDLLADKMELAKTEIGDLIVIFQSGAYGLTASPTAFLSQPKVVEVLV